MMHRVARGKAAAGLVASLGLVLASCETPKPASPDSADRTAEGQSVVRPGNLARFNGRVVPADNSTQASSIRETGDAATGGRRKTAGPPIDVSDDGDITLNYVDTDIREIVRQILGNILKVNYSIVPGFQGQATIQTSRPLKRAELLPTLQTLLSQTGGTMVYQNGLFRVGPTGDDSVVAPVVDGGSSGMGSQVVPLRYASAKQLAAVLQPYIGEGAKLLADPARNVLIVNGSQTTRASMADLIRVFDVDYLAGRSYALFPVKSGEPAKVAMDLQHALELDADGPLAGAMSVIPVEQANAIMVIAKRPGYLDHAARLVAQIDRITDEGGRNLHVYHLKNVQAQDLQPVLQRAINPPSGGASGSETPAPGNLPPTAEAAQTNSGAGGFGANSSPGGNNAVNPGAIGGSTTPGSPGGTQFNAQNGSPTGTDATAQQQPDLGQEPTGAAAKGPQIIADTKSNALIIVSTEHEYGKIEAAIRRLDIMPMQVLVDVTVAEVTLNNNLEYGTQFFLSHQGNRAILSNAQSSSTSVDTTGATTNSQLFNGELAPNFPGFALARTVGSAQFALEALKSVTAVKVISSPKLLILDRQQAKLQVGDLVPTITQSATSVVTSNSAIVNSVEYQQTGVILAVTPRINSGGLVTLDISQSVSQVVTTTSSSINSPTFQQRQVSSKVAVQDGDTISLAGLIQDSKTNDNSGLPFLKDIPVLGALFSTKTDNDTRTELLVLITPHVVYDQHDARALTDELRRKLAASSALVQ